MINFIYLNILILLKIINLSKSKQKYIKKFKINMFFNACFFKKQTEIIINNLF